MSASERILFQSVLSETLREQAFRALDEPDLFETRQAGDLSAALFHVFKKAPKGPPSVWLHQLEKEGHAQPLIDLELEGVAEPLTENLLNDSIDKLRKKREMRNLQASKSMKRDDAFLTEWLERRKKLDLKSD